MKRKFFSYFLLIGSSGIIRIYHLFTGSAIETNLSSTPSIQPSISFPNHPIQHHILSLLETSKFTRLVEIRKGARQRPLSGVTVFARKSRVPLALNNGSKREGGWKREREREGDREEGSDIWRGTDRRTVVQVVVNACLKYVGMHRGRRRRIH